MHIEEIARLMFESYIDGADYEGFPRMNWLDQGPEVQRYWIARAKEGTTGVVTF